MALLGLPDECLVHAMRQLGEARSQLTAARACARLRRAAAVALDVVAPRRYSLSVRSDAQRDSLQLYLGKHGQHVTSLCIDWGKPLRALPNCARLRELDLSFSDVQLAAGSSHQGVLQAATGLTRLVLSLCRIHDDASAVAAALAALTHLRELRWSGSDMHPDAALPGRFLSSLALLTRLELSSPSAIDKSTLQHLGCLTNLQELHVSAQDTVTAAACAGLQQLQQLQQLTSLWLQDLGVCVGSGLTAGISRLTALRQLTVRSCEGFAPACLAGLAQLQKLVLDGGTEVADGEGGVAVFLAQLAGLQQLQELKLCGALTTRAPAAAAYSALTASSHLSTLQLGDCVLPDGVWQHVFERTRPLPNLLSFRVFVTDEQVHEVEHAAALSAAAIDALVGCCQKLQDLTFTLGEPSCHALTPLLRLSALTCLDVAGVTDAAVLGAPLYQLTSLRRLEAWADDSHEACSKATLLQLTALRQLTYLRFPTTPADGLIDEDDDACVELWTPQHDEPPDVWSQLLQRCLQCDEPCQVPLSLLAQQAQALANATGQLSELAAVKVEAAELRSRVSCLEQLVTALLAVAGWQPQQQ